MGEGEEIFRTFALYGGNRYWIGLNKLIGVWTWPNSTIVSYWNWRSSQPDGCCGGNVYCVIANYVDQSGTWDDTGCNNVWDGFVCETNAEGAETTATPAINCPSSAWTPFATTGSCYLAMQQKANYYAAQQFCRIMGGDLVSITSAVEMSFVNTFYGGSRYWIGLNKLIGVWTWPNSTIPSYWNWRSGQPDGCCGENVYCVIANYVDLSGVWDDTGCNNVWDGFVCETSAVSAVTTATTATATITSTSTQAALTIPTQSTNKTCYGPLNSGACNPYEVCSDYKCQLVSSLPSCANGEYCKLSEECDPTFNVCYVQSVWP